MTTTKDDAPCCAARRLPDGRPVIGFCSPGCVRRAERLDELSATARLRERERELAEEERRLAPLRAEWDRNWRYR